MASRNGFQKIPVPGDASDPVGLTALLNRYLIWIETHNYAASTVSVRRRQLSRFILWCDERSVTKAIELTPAIIERFQRHLFYYRKHDGQPMNISSQCHWLTALRSWLAWLKDQKVIEQNPALDVQMPREEKRLPRHALTQSEVEAVLAQADPSTVVGLRTRAIMELLYCTALRRCEAVNLHLSDIDRDRHVVLVRQGKGKKDRFAPIGDRALAWIDRYLAEARPQLTEDPSQPVLFVTGTGNQLHANDLSLRVRRYMNQAGITKAGSCHLFRHTAATLMLDRGADIRHIQAILGHENISTTQIYTHVSIGKLCEVHAKTHPGQLLRGAPTQQASPPTSLPRRVLAAARRLLSVVRHSVA